MLDGEVDIEGDCQEDENHCNPYFFIVSEALHALIVPNISRALRWYTSIVHPRAGFTLVELLLVMGIVAVVAVAALTVLNPAQLMYQSRDSKRIQEVGDVAKAVQLFQLEQTALSLGSSSVVYISLPDASSTCGSYSLPTLPNGYTYRCAATSTYRNVDGTGWVPLNFTTLTGGAPLSVLPVDPRNTSASSLFYSYVTNGTSYVVRAQPESSKYATLASNNLS